MNKHQSDLFAHGYVHDLSVLTIRPDPVLVVDSDGVICACNVAAAELLEGSLSDLLSHPIYSFVPIECDIPSYPSRKLDKKKSINITTRLDATTIARQVIPVEVNIGTVAIEQTIFLLVSLRDISSEISTEILLRHSEKRFRDTIEHLSVGACHISLAGKLTMANQALIDFLGYKKKSLQALEFESIIHPDDVNAHISQAQALKRGHLKSYQIESRLKHASNNYVWAKQTISTVYNEQGVAAHYFAIIEDINSKKVFEKLLRESEIKFRTIVESLSKNAAVWMATPGFQSILYVNDGYKQIWGRTPDSLYENPLSFIDIVHPEDKEKVMTQLTHHASGDWDINYRIVRDDGETRYIHDCGQAIFDKNKIKFVVSLATDVTVEVTQKMMLIDALQEVKETNQRLVTLSKTDALTGTFNRQAIQEEASREFRRYKRYKEKSTVIFIDLNDFKGINDQFGHLAGDAALRSCATLLKDSLRETDFLGRYGGDEFIIILPNTGLSEAKYVLKKILELPLNTKFEDKTIQLTFSAGIATVNDDMNDEREWIKAADSEMYIHKQNNKK